MREEGQIKREHIYCRACYLARLASENRNSAFKCKKQASTRHASDNLEILKIKESRIIKRLLTEEISEAEGLASSPFLVVNFGHLLVVEPTQRITNCVVLVGFYALRIGEKYKEERYQGE